MRVVSLLIAVLLLAGCAKGAEDPASGLFGTRQSAERKPAKAPVEPRYCYRTLGAVNCYTQPLPGEEANRLIGYQGPSPRSTAGTGALTP